MRCAGCVEAPGEHLDSASSLPKWPSLDSGGGLRKMRHSPAFEKVPAPGVSDQRRGLHEGGRYQGSDGSRSSAHPAKLQEVKTFQQRRQPGKDPGRAHTPVVN